MITFFPECPSTLYGPNCNTTCSEYCQNKLCNYINGYCLECIEARACNLCENNLPAQGITLGFVPRTFKRVM